MDLNEIDTTRFFCPNETCPNYARLGPDNKILRAGYYGKGEKRTQMLKCKVCGKRFSIHKGTPLFNLKADEGAFYGTIAHLVEGNGIRATARIMGINKDTVSKWLKKASMHAEAVSQYLMANLHFEEVQLNEFWSFVKKRSSLHKFREVKGGILRPLDIYQLRLRSQNYRHFRHREDKPEKCRCPDKEDEKGE
nr:hypothetical protein BSM_25960 [uncultured archaeon]